MGLKVPAAIVAVIILAGTALWSIADQRRGGVGEVSSNFGWLGPTQR